MLVFRGVGSTFNLCDGVFIMVPLEATSHLKTGKTRQDTNNRRRRLLFYLFWWTSPCIYKFTYIYIYIYIHIYLHIYIYFIYMYLHIIAYVYIHICIHKYLQIHIFTGWLSNKGYSLLQQLHSSSDFISSINFEINGESGVSDSEIHDQGRALSIAPYIYIYTKYTSIPQSTQRMVQEVVCCQWRWLCENSLQYLKEIDSPSDRFYIVDGYQGTL